MQTTSIKDNIYLWLYMDDLYAANDIMTYPGWLLLDEFCFVEDQEEHWAKIATWTGSGRVAMLFSCHNPTRTVAAKNKKHKP